MQYEFSYKYALRSLYNSKKWKQKKNIIYDTDYLLNFKYLSAKSSEVVSNL